MIKLLPNFPENTIGLAGTGRVTASDYEEVLIPAIESALKKHKKLRLLYEFGSDFTGYAPDALWDDMKLSIEHINAWEKIAVVTDIAWIVNGTYMLKFIIPCTIRVFSLKDRATAETWIAA